LISRRSKVFACRSSLVGARRRERLQEALGALEVELTTEDVAAIERALPLEAVAGDATTRARWRSSTASAAPPEPRVCCAPRLGSAKR
jgi:hypothetical protein